MNRWFDPEAARSDPRLGRIGPRFLARIIDVLVVSALLYVVALIVQPDVKAGQIDWGLYALSAAVALLYEVPATALTGQTLGKRIARIRVTRVEDGGMPGANRALTRYLTVVVAGFVPLLGFFLAPVLQLWFLWDPRRQNITDKVARTLVVKVGQEAPGVVDVT